MNLAYHRAAPFVHRNAERQRQMVCGQGCAVVVVDVTKVIENRAVKKMPILICLIAFVVLARTAHAQDLVVLLTPRSVPFSWIDEREQLVGFNVDFIRAVCREMRRHCRLETRRFPEIIPELASGAAAIGVANYLRTPERERQVAYSLPYWRSSSAFVGREGGTTVAASGRICVIAGTMQQAWLATGGRQGAAEVVALESNEAVLDGLGSGGCPVALLPVMQVLPFLQSVSGQGFGFVGAPLDGDGLGGPVHIVVRHGDDSLLEAVNRAITHLISSGEHERLARKYFPFSIL